MRLLKNFKSLVLLFTLIAHSLSAVDAYSSGGETQVGEDLGADFPEKAPAIGRGNSIPVGQNSAPALTKDEADAAHAKALAEQKKREAARLAAEQKAADERKAADLLAREKARIAAAKKRAEMQRGTIPNQSTTQEVVNREHDLNLINQIKQDEKDGKPLTEEIAKRAIDSDIRKHLLAAVDSEEKQTQLAKEEVDLSKAMGQLIQIAAAAAQRSQTMGNVDPADKGFVKNWKEGGRDKSTITDSALKQATEVSNRLDHDKELVTRLEAALAKAEANEKAAGKTLTPEQKAALREKIRTSLRNQIVAAYKAKVADAALNNASAYSAEGQLKREHAPTANEEANNDSNHGMGDVIGSTFSAYQNSSHQEPGFSMAASDTQAAVDGILEQSSRDLASDAAAGVLGEETPALFLRVREAHQRAIKRSLLRVEP